MAFKPEYAKGLKVIEQLNGEVNLSGVTFKYNEESGNVFNGLNLHIDAKDAVVIHGDEGSGKTTLLLLLASLLKPGSGTIQVDGNDLNNVDLESYRSKIAYMPDNGELFSGTIMENLTLFENEKYEDEAKRIAKEIGLHEIIEKMPLAYNTEVGSGTVDLLSKGHKQQVLIVRSLLNNPAIILFDEANMALDIDSDVKLRKFLLSQKGKCTIVLVTHRPSLLEMANKHFKIENGVVTEFKWQ